MGAEQNRRTLERAYAAFNRHDLEAVRETAADGFVDHGASADAGAGFEATRSNVGRFMEAFPDARWEVLDMIVDDHGAAVRLIVSGTHRGPFMGIEPTGERIVLEDIDYLHFNAEGLVTDRWGGFDRLALMEQLGVRMDLVRGS